MGLADAQFETGILLDPIPEHLRATFSRELPYKTFGQQHAAYTTHWDYGDELCGERLHPDIQHYLPIIKHFVDIGELGVASADQRLIAAVRQGIPRVLSPDCGKHTDGYAGIFKRVVVSDMLGTLALNSNGDYVPTPDYHGLLVGPKTPHGAQNPIGREVRTRLQLSLHSLIDGTVLTPVPVVLE